MTAGEGWRACTGFQHTATPTRPFGVFLREDGMHLSGEVDVSYAHHLLQVLRAVPATSGGVVHVHPGEHGFLELVGLGGYLD